ncbi:MAG: asparagine synthase (glutamine-hydrolyzing) [Burkholderiales bacterium]
MCGIIGVVDAPWRADARRALDTIASRGPDDEGWFDGEGVTLGHRRLSIIDLAGGHQPMRSADGRYVIVFNGEIYNFQDLRDELVTAGRAFITHSDTEVLLHGYAVWGKGLLQRLDGMFAFALWDVHARRLFAARDRMGVKPFFFSTVRGMTFASTLEPFFALGEFPAPLDYQALRDFLAFQTPLAPRTFLADVQQLLPANWLEYDAHSQRLQTGAFWAIPAPRAEANVDRNELIERVDLALSNSVQRQLVADVPLGAFLSGGIDSGLMVHYMARAGARPLRTFTVRFPQVDLDETPHARAVAAQFGAEHHIVDAPAIDGDTFAATLDALDQPLADPAYVPTLALARLTRSMVTVAISGDGGDELFGGYSRFRVQEADHPKRPWQAAMRTLIDARLLPEAMLRRSLWGRELLLYRKVELGPYAVSRKSMRAYVSEEAWRACRPERTLERWMDLTGSFGHSFDTAALMRADLWTYLSENCLVKTDRASMAASLEVRVPMLGNDVLDTVLDLPASAHFDPDGKAILRELARRYLPESVWNRPKHGFSVPLESSLIGPWRKQCEAWLATARKSAPFLNHVALHTLWNRTIAGRGSARLMYTFIVLLAWLARHRVRL